MTKKGRKKQEKGFDIAEMVNEIGKEVDEVLESHNEEKYFEEVMLLYSLIENLLKWLVFVKAMWETFEVKHYAEKWDKLESFCSGLSFYNALNMALSVKLMDFNLYKKIDKVRKERNNIAHELWIYERRRNPVELEKTLEVLKSVAKALAKILEQVASQIGIEGVYKISLSKDGG
jgi:hypothetical protein